MNAKELAEKIYSDILSRQTSTTSILREARRLGKMMKIDDFNWVESELKGYDTSKEQIPPYRTVNALETKTWTTHLNTTLQVAHSTFLKGSEWIKWSLYGSVSELENYVSTGFKGKTGTILKTLGFTTGEKTPIYQVIEVAGTQVKEILDRIQDRVQVLISEILAEPIINRPSVAILLVFSNKFDEMKMDLEKISEYIENGADFTLAARSCRPPLHALIRSLVPNSIPKKYIFSDGIQSQSSGEKSKMKYYLEQKGIILFKDKTKLLFMDEMFREIYDISSKADKHPINQYEANYCIDKMLNFLEKLHRYTDLKPIS